MNLAFTKMHALGNDFVVLDFTQQSYPISAEFAAHIADRHLGVGCDQILIVEPSTTTGIDFRYRILNADGSEVGQCGNGSRCFAHFVRAKGLSTKSTISVETLSGVMHLSLDDTTGLVKVDMGQPRLEASEIPLSLPTANRYTVQLDTTEIEFSAVSMGNPHAVIRVDDIATAKVAELGTQLQAHSVFSEGVNVGFMQILSPKHIALRVFERGTGETLACGSGACAAVVAGIQMGELESDVTVTLPGGELSVSWQGDGHSVIMSGPATRVFEGVLTV